VPAANTGESVTTAPAVTVTTDVPPAGADAGRGWRIAGIASAAGGVGLVVAGLAFGAAAENAADSVSQRYSSSTEQDGKRYETLQWVGYGAGVVAIAAGTLMYLHGQRMRSASESGGGLHGRAILNPNGGGFVLEGVFP
jgi:hypothetical protein